MMTGLCCVCVKCHEEMLVVGIYGDAGDKLNIASILEQHLWFKVLIFLTTTRTSTDVVMYKFLTISSLGKMMRYVGRVGLLCKTSMNFTKSLKRPIKSFIHTKVRLLLSKRKRLPWHHRLKKNWMK